MPARLITWASASARTPEIHIVLLGARAIRVANNPDNSGTKFLVGRDGLEDSDFGRVVNLGTIEEEHHDEGLGLMDALCHTRRNGCGTKRRSRDRASAGTAVSIFSIATRKPWRQAAISSVCKFSSCSYIQQSKRSWASAA